MKDRANAQRIEPRHMQFQHQAPRETYWYDGNPLITGFFYALSATFPDGERFFIDSVRHYQARVSDPVLSQQIRGFIGQEAHHGRVHEDYNAAVESLGLPMGQVAAKVRRLLGFIQRRFSPARQLAITAALEHLTATFADYLLNHPEHHASADPAFRQMMIWHAVEEIEHKAVAFDVYRDQVDSEHLRRRAGAMVMAMFFLRIGYYQWLLLRGQPHATLAQWRRAVAFFWGRDGMLRRSLRPLLQYFRRGFHPADIDQRALIDNWQQRYPEVAALQRA